MNDFGSGWQRAEGVLTDECYVLCANYLGREKLLGEAGERSGLVEWADSERKIIVNSVEINVELDEINVGLDEKNVERGGINVRPSEARVDGGNMQGVMRLKYSLRNVKDPVDEPIGLVTTRLPRGGVRWWFLCPRMRGETVCGRRVGKLYRPVDQTFFGCRHCYGLKYRSSRGAHRDGPLYELVGRDCGLGGKEVRKRLMRWAGERW